MKDLKYFNTNDDYTSNKDTFEYPTVSYVEEDTKVYYVNPPASLINIHYEIKDEEQLQMINEMVSSSGNKLPLLMRSDLIEEAKLDGQDITSQLHKGEPYVFTATTTDDKMTELSALLMGESGFTDYVIAVDGPFEIGSSWDLEVKFKDGITDCIGLFDTSIALSEISENLFSNCTDVTDFSNTFASCYGLTSVPANLFINNTAVTTFSGTFSSCSGLTSIPENLFSNNTKVADFNYTFYNCSGLTGSIPENLFSNNTAVTSFYGTFMGCSGLTNIPENLFKYNTTVTTFQSTFEVCSGLISIPANLFSNNTAVTNFNYTFLSCTGLTGNVPVDNDGKPIYNRSGEGKDGYEIVTYYNGCFSNCQGLSDYSSIPEDWK